jgi:hypothetical protein
MCTAEPVKYVCRVADVLPDSGVNAVSERISRTFSSGTPTSSAAICAIILMSPCPTSQAPE